MLEEYEEIWATSQWTQEARSLIDEISKISEEPNLFMFLRHSHRESIGNVTEMANLGLTEQGKEIAKIFGSKLPLNKTIHFYYSTIARCKETAECILEGFKQSGGKGKLIRPLKPLYSVDGEPEYIIDQIFRNPDKELINRWAAGHFPSEKIQPLSIFSQYTAKKVFNILNKASPNDLSIFLTHDLQIMALRYSWFSLEPCDYWVSYLGGFIISNNKNKTKLVNKGKIRKVKVPYWWKDL